MGNSLLEYQPDAQAKEIVVTEGSKYSHFCRGTVQRTLGDFDMGFWGVGPFENDAAADFVDELTAKGKPSKLQVTLTRVIKARPSDIDDWLAAEGIAAAEAVAAARGYPHPKCAEELLSWANKNKQAASDRFSELAMRAVDRIRSDSELAEMMGEDGNSQAWKSSLARLQSRLTRPARILKLKTSLAIPPTSTGDERKAKTALKKKEVVFGNKGKRFVCVSHPRRVTMQLRDSDLAHFSAIPGLTILRLTGRQGFSDRGAKHLAHLRNLVNLTLDSPSLTDASADIFGTMKKLRQLNLEGTRYGDEAARYIATLRNLSELDLSKTKVTDAGLAHVSACRRLKVLGLEGTEVTDKAMPSIAALTSLQVLMLSRTAVTANGVNSLGSLASLRNLQLRNTQVGDEACETIAGFKHLVDLGLRHTKLTGAGVSHLTKLKRLVRLKLDGLPLSDSDMETLLSFPKKTCLSVEGTKLSDDAIARLRRAGRFVFAGFDRTP